MKLHRTILGLIALSTLTFAASNYKEIASSTKYMALANASHIQKLEDRRNKISNNMEMRDSIRNYNNMRVYARVENQNTHRQKELDIRR
ncbi:hypothetical protein JHD48_05415 [Sulfurimonas sp. SAG-AH-194-I05]|nr:hypothetical protein [Sulfurimonas sp. SAG-AH-194-I05]MDF1875166.1 hypothetical protein [Sulfurimonas sp. SAG-AH-194-I05]